MKLTTRSNAFLSSADITVRGIVPSRLADPERTHSSLEPNIGPKWSAHFHVVLAITSGCVILNKADHSLSLRLSLKDVARAVEISYNNLQWAGARYNFEEHTDSSSFGHKDERFLSSAVSGAKIREKSEEVSGVSVTQKQISENERECRLGTHRAAWWTLLQHPLKNSRNI